VRGGRRRDDAPWRGSVRELENVVEQALILHGAGPLRFELGPRGSPAPLSPTPAQGPPRPLDEGIRAHILVALAHTDGRIHGEGGAAQLLGLNPSTLRGKMRRLGLPFGAELERVLG